jgi:hypothetical protein
VPHVVGVCCVFGFHCVATSDYHVPNVSHVIGVYKKNLLSQIPPLLFIVLLMVFIVFVDFLLYHHYVVLVHHLC